MIYIPIINLFPNDIQTIDNHTWDGLEVVKIYKNIEHLQQQNRHCIINIQSNTISIDAYFIDIILILTPIYLCGQEIVVYINMNNMFLNVHTHAWYASHLILNDDLI